MGVAELTYAKRRSIIRTVAVVGLGIVALAGVVPQIAYYWIPRGDFGVRDVIPNGSTPFIRELAPQSAAADAGLRVGDQIEAKYLSLHEYNIGCCSLAAKPGEFIKFHIVRGGKEKTVTLVARPVYMSAAEIKRNIWDQIIWLLRILLGGALVLLRPGRLTWMFYLWQVGVGDANPPPDYILALPGWLFVVCALPYVVLGGAVSFVGAIFSLVFPKDEPTGWRRRAVPFVVVILWVSVALALARFIASSFKLDTSGSDWVPAVQDVAGGLISVAALVTYYVTSRGFDRQRVRWVIVVVVAADLGEIFWNLRDLLGAPPPFYADFYLRWTGLFIVIAFAYAIIRYGMFDVEFILSRALVYTLLALAAIGIFIAIDAAFTSRFRGSKAELATDIALALGLGFWVRAIQGRATDLVDRLFFKRRFLSRMRLKEVFDRLAAANSVRTVEEILTSGAASALGLASAVFFRRVADGGLLREIGAGWPADSVWHLLPDDKLVQALEKNAPTSIDLRALGWSRVVAPPPNQPVLAVPTQAGRRNVGVTFYGSRSDGVLPSPDEVGGLIELAHRAASVYLMLDSARSKMAPRDLAAARISR